jgi:hypothetical protein
MKSFAWQQLHNAPSAKGSYRRSGREQPLRASSMLPKTTGATR